MLRFYYKFCLLTISILGNLVAYNQPLDVTCLTDNRSADIESSFKEIIALESKNKVILVGETHGVSETFDLYFDLITNFFKGNISNKFLLSERSYAEAELFNNFLITGDIQFLKYDVAWSKEMQLFFEKLYIFNLELPADNKIRFLGVDAIHSSNAFVLSIQNLLPNTSPPPRIASFVDSVRRIQLPLTFKPTSSKEYFLFMDNLLMTLRSEILKNTNEYMIFLGGNYKHVKAIISSNSTYSQPGKRNENMFRNLKIILGDQYLEGTFLGLFGSNHIMNLQGSKSFGQLLSLSPESPVRNVVFRALIHYENSLANFNNNIVEVPSLLETLLKKNEKEFKEKVLSESKCSNLIIKTADFNRLKENCEYIILISNAKPVVRF